MPLPGRAIQRIIKKYVQYSSPHNIIRYGDRTAQTYDTNGDPIPLSSVAGTINLHHQPMAAGQLIKDLREGQRLEDMRKGWTVEEINYKDRVVIDGAWFTPNAIQPWPGQTGHKEIDFIRTGEQDNIA